MEQISIMYIDDDEDDRDLFLQALMKIDNSYKYSESDNSVNAIELLKATDTKLPDLIFLDFNMPLMDGFECLKEIRKIAPLKETPIIFYSTSQRFEINNYKIYNPVDYVCKPVEFEDIIQSIKHIINKYL